MKVHQDHLGVQDEVHQDLLGVQEDVPEVRSETYHLLQWPDLQGISVRLLEITTVIFHYQLVPQGVQFEIEAMKDLLEIVLQDVMIEVLEDIRKK